MINELRERLVLVENELQYVKAKVKGLNRLIEREREEHVKEIERLRELNRDWMALASVKGDAIARISEIIREIKEGA